MVDPALTALASDETCRQSQSDAAVLLISGYTAGEFEQVPEGCHFLAKPFSPAELAVAVRSALDLAVSPTR